MLTLHIWLPTNCRRRQRFGGAYFFLKYLVCEDRAHGAYSARCSADHFSIYSQIFRLPVLVASLKIINLT